MDKVVRTDEEWRQILTPLQYEVLRHKATEQRFSGEHYNNTRKGKYVCAGCGNLLFDASAKYDSGSGWPAFFRLIDPAAVETLSDYEIGYERTEVQCSRCGGHLGHVFDDGPPPTGKRYCMNSASLDFIPDDD